VDGKGSKRLSGKQVRRQLSQSGFFLETRTVSCFQKKISKEGDKKPILKGKKSPKSTLLNGLMEGGKLKKKGGGKSEL